MLVENQQKSETAQRTIARTTLEPLPDFSPSKAIQLRFQENEEEMRNRNPC